jgi:hypothetical protein
MDVRVIVMAETPIPYGAEVLVRGTRACLCDPALANARVVRRPPWLDEEDVIPPRRTFAVELIDRARDLQALADGPIMDAVNLYVPAGRLNWADTKAREAAVLLEFANG